MFNSIPLVYYAITGLVNCFTTLTLSLLVFTKNYDSKTNRRFSLFAFSVAIWSILYFLWLRTDIKSMAEFYLRTCMIFVIFMPALFFHFVISFLNLKIERKYVAINYILGVLFSLTVYTSGYASASIPFFNIPYWLQPGPVFHIALIHFTIVVVSSCYLMYGALKKAKGIFRDQLRYVLIGSLIGFSSGSTNYFGWYKILIMPPVLNFFVSVYMGIIAYAILRYRLMDIRIAITRTGLFITVYSLLLSIPFLVVVWYKNWLMSVLGGIWWIVPLVLMAFLATTAPFIYIYLEKKAEARLLKEQRHYQDTLKQASVGITRIRDLRKLLDLIIHIITKAVKISHMGVYLFNEQNNEYVLELSRNKRREVAIRLSFDNPLINWINSKHEPLIYEEIRYLKQNNSDEIYAQVEENMRLISAAVIVPSFLEDRLLGFFVLGDKVSGEIYTADDLNVFQVLASHAALAIENAKFYEESKEMQDRISQAEKMATIGTMADGLSHQINNRFYALSLITSDTIDSIKRIDFSKCLSCSSQIKKIFDETTYALSRIQANVLQGGEVVRGMLKYTRRGEEGFESLDLNAILDNTLEMVQFKVKLSEIDFVRSFSNMPKIKGNLTQLEEVFFNFIDNAYEAILERSVMLKEEGYRGRVEVSAQPKNDEIMEIAVIDNGIGVKEEDKRKIFTPFFTTKSSSRKGTGLGLYVIKRIITEMHKGRLSFESQYKAGTRFILELPIAGNSGTHHLIH